MTPGLLPRNYVRDETDYLVGWYTVGPSQITLYDHNGAKLGHATPVLDEARNKHGVLIGNAAALLPLIPSRGIT